MAGTDRRVSGNISLTPTPPSPRSVLTRESLATLRTGKRLDEKEDATASKLAHALHVMAEEVDSRLNVQTAAKLKAEFKAVAYLIDNIANIPNKSNNTNNGDNQGVKDLTNKLEKTNDAIRELTAQIDMVAQQTASTTQELKEIKKSNSEVADQMKEIPATMEKNATAYRDALLSSSTNNAYTKPPSTTAIPQTEDAARILAKYAVQDRQLLFDYPKDYKGIRPNIDATRELVNKAIAATSPTDTIDTEIKALSPLLNGGILLELASPEVVRWINEDKERRNVFEQTFGHEIKIRTRMYPLLIMTVPVHLDLSSETLMRELEEVNDVPTGSFDRMTWMKPPHRRHERQTIGFARLLVSSRAFVNRFSSQGIIIAGKRVNARRDIQEALRCNKCQKYRHMARNCLNEQRCATCGDPHGSEACTSTERFCVSCNITGHPSWSRDCPAFKDECRKIEERRPYDATPFFYSPTEPWTHPIPRPAAPQNFTLTPSQEGIRGPTAPRQPAPFPTPAPQFGSTNRREWGESEMTEGWDTYQIGSHGQSQTLPPGQNRGWRSNLRPTEPNAQARFDKHAYQPMSYQHPPHL